MGYSSSGGPKGLGVFNNTPQTVSDLNQEVALIAAVGNLRVGTTAERDALTGSKLYEGLLFSNTTTDTIDRHNGSGWVRIIEDTGWVSVTPSGTGFTPSGTGIRFRRINGVVHFSIRATSASWSGSWAMSPIPTGYEPAATLTFIGSYGTAFYELAFNPAGNIIISGAGTGGILASGSYPVG